MQKSDYVWVVVLVERGIPTQVEAYSDERAAEQRGKYLVRDIQPDEDEVSVVRVRLDSQRDSMLIPLAG